MTATATMKFSTGETPHPDIVILTHHLTRNYDMGGEVVLHGRAPDSLPYCGS